MKIIKKIVMIIILLLMVILDIWLIKDFENITVRTGIIDRDEKVKVKRKYSTINAVDLFENYEYMGAFKEDIFGNLKESLYIDLNGNEYYNSTAKNNWNVKPEFYQNRAATYSESIGKEGYIDWNGNKTSKFIYDYTDNYKNGYAKVGIYENKELKYGVIDLDGNQVIPCTYIDIDMIDCDNDIFYAEENNITYVINKNNIKIAELIEDDKMKFINLEKLTELGELDIQNVGFSKDYVLIRGNNEKYGFFTIEGKQLCDFKYDSFESISSQYLFLVEESGKKYIIDDKLNNIMDTKNFDENGLEIDSIENSRVRVIKNDKYGIADFNGNIIINPEYDNVSIQTAKCGYFSIEKDNKYGIANLNGNEIIKLSKKYKQPILGNGEYFVVKTINKNYMLIWVLVIIITIIIEILILTNLIKSIKRKRIKCKKEVKMKENNITIHIKISLKKENYRKIQLVRNSY